MSINEQHLEPQKQQIRISVVDETVQNWEDYKYTIKLISDESKTFYGSYKFVSIGTQIISISLIILFLVFTIILNSVHDTVEGILFTLALLCYFLVIMINKDSVSSQLLKTMMLSMTSIFFYINMIASIILAIIVKDSCGLDGYMSTVCGRLGLITAYHMECFISMPARVGVCFDLMAVVGCVWGVYVYFNEECPARACVDKYCFQMKSIIISIFANLTMMFSVSTSNKLLGNNKVLSLSNYRLLVFIIR